MLVRSGADELAVPDVHARMRHFRLSKVQQVTGFELAPVHRLAARPFRLHAGIARHDHSAAAAKHLHKTGTIETKRRHATPYVRQAQKPLTEGDGFADAQWMRTETYITSLHPADAIVRQVYLQPAAFLIAPTFITNVHQFEPGLERYGRER